MGTGEPAPPTEAAPTDFAGLDAAETEAAYAWALDYEDATPTQQLMTPRRITAMGLAVSLAVIAVAGAVVFVVIRDVREDAKHGRPVLVGEAMPALSGSYIPPKPPPPPVTVTQTVKAEPPPPQRSPDEIAAADPGPTAAQDAYFLSLIQADGWNVRDPVLAAGAGHEYCRSLRNGTPAPILVKQLAIQSGYTLPAAQAFGADAQIAYPGCRFGVG